MIQQKQEKPPVILVVDDIRQNLQVVGKHLADNGYDIAIANTGEQALEIIESIVPDLILLDIMMPGMNGFEVCEKLKVKPETAEVPIIFLTAKTQEEDIIKGFDLGAIDYVTKPFIVNELLARVRTHLDLKYAREELKELNAAKDRLFSIIAHDLKSPLSGITSLTELAQLHLADATREEIGGDITAIHKSARNLLSLLENLLSWSTFQSGVMAFRPDIIGLSEIAATAAALFESKCTSKNITISNTISPEVTVYADVEMVMTIFRNLVGNALKFSHTGQTITLSANPGEKLVEISVADQGVGIPPDKLDQLFSLQSNYSTQGTQHEKGTGLGLKLCQDLTHKNGGTIRVESEPGKGTTIIFTLPRHRPH